MSTMILVPAAAEPPPFDDDDDGGFGDYGSAPLPPVAVLVTPFLGVPKIVLTPPKVTSHAIIFQDVVADRLSPPCEPPPIEEEPLDAQEEKERRQSIKFISRPAQGSFDALEIGFLLFRFLLRAMSDFI